MANLIVPPRTPSPKVRIRSQSFDSPSLRICVTPIEESPFSKSTGAIATETFLRHDVLQTVEEIQPQPTNTLLPLHTKMSDESILSDASSVSSSDASSSVGPDENVDLASESPLPSVQCQRQRPHPLTFCQSIAEENTAIRQQPSSPFMYQDTSVPMYSPWLVRVVLDLHDVRRLDWTSIAEPIERRWGVRTSSAEVLNILSDNGRVLNRRWWD